MPTPLTTAQQVATAESATTSPVADLLAATQQLVNFTIPAEDLPTAGSGAATLGRIGTLYAPFLAFASGLQAAIHALSLELQALLPSSAITFTSITPNSVAQGASAISLSGVCVGAPSDTTLVFSDPKITLVDAPIVASDGNSFTAHINVDANATVGAGTVKLHSATAGDSGTLPFTVTAPTTATLVLTSGGTPITEIAGTVGVDYDIDGAYLPSDTGRTTNVLADCDVTTSNTAVVTADAPTITSVDYTSIPQGQSKLVTITGTNARSTVQTLGGVTSSGLSQSGFTRISDTEWQVTLTATSGAAVATDNLYIADPTHGDSNTVAESVTAAITSVTVAPSSFSIATGSTQQLTADDQLSTDITTQCAWTSSDPSVATVGASTGLVTGVSAGTCTITAAANGHSGTSAATVIAAPSDVSILHTVKYESPNASSALFTFTVPKPTPGSLLSVTLTYGFNGTGTRTNITAAPDGSWTKAGESVGPDGCRGATWEKIAGDEPTSYTFTNTSGAGGQSGVYLEISGANATTPINQYVGSTAFASGTSLTSPSATPTVVGTRALAVLHASSNGSGNPSVASTDWTLVALATPAAGSAITCLAQRTALTTDTTTPINCTFTTPGQPNSALTTLCVAGA